MAGVEIVMWAAILNGMGGSLGGFSKEYYLAYALWATFLGRASANWMYEFKMMEEIDTGRINSILVRPISFFEYYLAQFMGYKMLIAYTSLIIPIVGSFVLDVPFELHRLPIAMALTMFYLIFVHTLSFSVACFAFFLNRAYSFSVIKNITLWILAGELVPLDLYPEPLKTWLIHAPFSAGVYIPAGFVTGRFGLDLVLQSFVSVSIGIIFVGMFAMWIWRRGLRAYTGTGA